MKSAKTIFLLFSLAVMLMGFGCGNVNQSSDSSNKEDFYADFKPPDVPTPTGPEVDTSQYKKPEGEQLVIGYSDASLGNSWRVMAKAETEYAISELPNAKLVYSNANDSVPKQIADVEDMITRGVDAIIISATDVNGLCPSVSKAVNAGIPVIVQERKVNCKDYTVWVSDNAPQVGRFHMEYIAQRLNGEGKIAIVSGVPGAGHSVEIEEHYKDVLKEYPDIEVVAKEYAEYDPAKAQQVTDALLVAHPDLDAIASISGNITIGVFQAARQAGKVEQLKAWTGDDANGWMKIHSKNNLPSMTVPLPPKAGRDAVFVAHRVLQGKPVTRTVYVEKWAPPLEFSKNIDKYANFERPDEWWYTDMPCSFDPFCKN